MGGKLGVKFTIESAGNVSSVELAGVEHVQLRDCMTRVIKSLKFPAAKGGGITIVNYPFIFHRTE